ncbi:MAG TPA: histone family protein [Candidatus Nanoarchaeia archaeon]|nr:histone family protein [Candidatus Nanoarchaeia archaeon]
MTNEKKILPLAAMEKLLKKSGAPRVSEDAKEVLRELLEEYAEQLGEKSIKIALHSGRKTVKGSDIKLSLK